MSVGKGGYRGLIDHTPTALWYVDARGAGEVFDRLRAEGVTDIRAHFDAHPELAETGKDIVMVTEANRAAVALFGAADAAELVRPVRYLFAATPDLARRVMIAHFEGRRNHIEQAKVATFDGRILDVLFCVVFPAEPEDLETSFITIEDITERLQTEAQLRRLQADFAHAARVSLLGELATSIAHEVKQPLAAILTNAETSLRWLGREEPDLAKVGQLTTRIAASACRANEIILRIQAMAAKHDPERVLLDLNHVVEEALLFVRHEMETKAIDLSAALASDLPAILGDRVQLQQVVVNLLVNAIQAMSPDQAPGRRIELATTVGDDGALALSVRDSGPGIPDANLGRIFDGFFTTKPSGMGIGLAICQSIITAHGGEIVASNHPAGGAVFQVVLPPGSRSTLSQAAA
jgi:C4-dicarboxylate-specific signal transduction histidine kinase